MDNEQKILKAMKDAGKPLKSGEVAEMTGIDKKEVSKIINNLKKEGTIISPKRCYYETAS
ncbi:putative transcriptional regulator, Crp/Fnr family [Methanosalsum zhilinae DSM 4017]|uniref:Putative transcriptional regulator, Crp/Fnr family n=1 Tax=Methanosalsum zhilinae (strain DSM 4017 / NBRC 107636 / OCM 62 / WeN5) TaxID=679901 RepID=F7XMM9_METZD|nr:winged helix-turn-helix transcriptional regulator [Methanosalsum zhilinae]AEH61044.1 putative transcriptional regulator, Crp/Fnr family [Methanosalsum zhilinae DSM 4017]